MPKKILIMGLPGAGKTELARVVAKHLGAVHYNADHIRASIGNFDFSPAGRIAQANRMSVLADIVNAAGHHAVCDFVCPTKDTRNAFAADFLVWCDAIPPAACRYPDTAAIFEAPFDWETSYRAATLDAEHHGLAVAQKIGRLTPFDWTKPTALFIGRWQPFHDGHFAIVSEGIERVGQVCIAVRSRPHGESDPFPFHQVRDRIIATMKERNISPWRYTIIKAPNITTVMHGRDVGWSVEEISVTADIAAISGTELRRQLQTDGQGKARAISPAA